LGRLKAELQTVRHCSLGGNVKRRLVLPLFISVDLVLPRNTVRYK